MKAIGEELESPGPCSTDGCGKPALPSPIRWALQYCSECRERGRLEREAEEARYRDRLSRERLGALLTHSGVPKRFHDLDPARFVLEGDQSSAYSLRRTLRDRGVVVTAGNSLACRLIRDFEPGKSTHSIYLFGDVGRGKTFLSYLFVQLVVRAGVGVWMVTPAELLDMKRSTFDARRSNQSREPLPDPMVRAATVELLVLDDLGMEAISSTRGDWAREQLEQLIDLRYRAGLPILMTSNQPFHDQARLGERAWSRLQEMVGDNVAEVKGASFRVPPACE